MEWSASAGGFGHFMKTWPRVRCPRRQHAGRISKSPGTRRSARARCSTSYVKFTGHTARYAEVPDTAGAAGRIVLEYIIRAAAAAASTWRVRGLGDGLWPISAPISNGNVHPPPRGPMVRGISSHRTRVSSDSDLLIASGGHHFLGPGRESLATLTAATSAGARPRLSPELRDAALKSSALPRPAVRDPACLVRSWKCDVIAPVSNTLDAALVRHDRLDAK